MPPSIDKTNSSQQAQNSQLERKSMLIFGRFFFVLFSRNILVVYGSVIQLMLTAYCTLIGPRRSVKQIQDQLS